MQLEIDIVAVNIIEGGIEVFAKATKDGSPVGFGADGTIETERFQIFDPPVLVPDGTSQEVYNPGTDETISVTNFKEDPEESLRLKLVHLINTVGKDGTNIIPGSVGNTTSNFAVTQDAYLSVVNATTWAGAHDATSGSIGDDTLLALLARQENSSNWDIRRVGMTFDTSSIGSDTVSSATLSLYHTTAQQQASVDASTVDIVNFTPADPTALVGDDYDQFDTTVHDDIAILSIVDDAYTAFTIPTGVISTSSYTSLGARIGEDTDDNSSLGSNNILYFSSSNVAGTSEDPDLTVEHAAGGGGGQNSNFLAFM